MAKKPRTWVVFTAIDPLPHESARGDLTKGAYVGLCYSAGSRWYSAPTRKGQTVESVRAHVQRGADYWAALGYTVSVSEEIR